MSKSGSSFIATGNASLVTIDTGTCFAYSHTISCIGFIFICFDLFLATFIMMQILLLGDKLKDALSELEKVCHSSTAALPFRLLRHHVIGYRVKNLLSYISSLILYY